MQYDRTIIENQKTEINRNQIEGRRQQNQKKINTELIKPLIRLFIVISIIVLILLILIEIC